MKFIEEKLEQAVIELFVEEGYEHVTGDKIHKELEDVLLRDDLRQYLLQKMISLSMKLKPLSGSWNFSHLQLCMKAIGQSVK